MKKINNYIKHGIIILLTGFFILGANNKSIAQACNQVEILYQQPDCYKPKGSDGAIGPGQERNCTPITVCVNQPYTYTAGGVWASYLWVITSGPATPPINPNATSANVNITWPLVGTYILTLTVTDAGGNVFTKCLEVTVKEKPVANFTFNFNNACAGSTINFINGTVFSGTPSYSWNFGDPLSNSNTSALQDPSHLYANAGTYIVTLIAYSTMLVPGGGNGQHGDSLSLVTCCADTIKKTVTILPSKVKIECISTVCAGDTAKYTAVGCGSPVWGTPVGGTIINTTGNQVIVVWGNGNPQGQLSVICGACTSYVTVPIVPSNPIIVGNTSPCNNALSSYAVPYLPGTFYTWTLTELPSTNANNLLSTYPDNNTVWINWANAIPGATYQLSITLLNKHLCCTSTGSINITPKQKFIITGPSGICAGQNVTFSTNPGGTFNWTVAPTTGVVPPSSPGTAFYNAAFNTAGTFVITATDVSSSFCNTTASTSVQVIPMPVAGTIIGPLIVCLNGQYTYSMSTNAPLGWYYEWTITSGSFQPGNITPTIAGNSVTVLWTGYGTLSVVLKQSASPFCQVTGPSITVTAATVGSVSGTLNVCVDGSGSYTLTGGNLAPGEVITWTISPSSHGTITAGQGTSTITVLWHGQVGPGPWGPVTISASTGCGPAVPLGGIMIYPKFNLTITSSGIDICQPGGLTLTANGAPPLATYLWTPGGQTTQSISPVTTAGIYTVTAIKGGCTAYKTFTVTDPFLIIPVTCGVGTCNGLNTNEQLGVAVVKPIVGTFTYQWYSGVYPSGTLIPSATTPNYLAPTYGSYYVVVTYGTCSKYVAFNVAKVCCPDVNNPTITNVTQISCNKFSFTATTPNPTGATITWYFGDGTTAPGASGVPIIHTYANAGVYCVKFCVGPPSPNPTNCTGNCIATKVTVPIQANFLYTLGCNGCLNVINTSTVIISPPASVSYLWNFGDGNTSTAQNPGQHCYANPGSYTVTLTITYNNNAVPVLTCTSVATQTVIYTPLAINFNTPVCTGSPVNFTSSPGGFITYSWNFGDGGTAYTASTTHIYNTAGIYTVTLSVTDALGNTCTVTKKDTVLAGISSCTILPAFLCPGSTATLIGPAGPYTYLWEVETGLNVWAAAPGVNNTVNYTTTVPGFYHVIVSNANNCTCTSNKVEVKTVPKPKASFTISPSKNICQPGGMITLTAPQVGGYTYAWYANGNYGSSIGGGPFYMTFVSVTTIYNLIVTNQYGCKDTCTQTVTVNPLPAPPVISSNPTGTLCEGGPITLTVTNYANNITWNTGATTLSIIVTTAGTYIATYTNPLTGCSASKKIVVNRRPSAGLFPHFCDSIPCNCSRPFVIYAPNPLIGAFASNYNINWYNANTNVLLGSGPSYNNGGLGVQTGSYYIIITDQTTGCKDTSNNYSVIVPKCDTCDCKESKWGKIILSKGVIAAANKNIKDNVPPAAGETELKCNNNYTLKCNQPYTINASYICKDTSCPGKVTYSLQPPSGLPITGDVPATFTPTLNGVYILTLYGWCGNKKCDSCIIDLTVKCDTCDCKGSKWGEKTYTIDNVTKSITCMKPNDKAIDVKCKTPITINANYNCTGANCPGAVTYSLVQPSGTTTGNVPLTFTANQTGTYIVTLYGMCGTTVCDSCVIKFSTKCVEDTTCCPYNITVKETSTQTTQITNPNATVANSTFSITGPTGNLFTEIRADVINYTLTDNYNKECINCKSFPYSWASIYQAGNIGAIVPKITMYGGTTVHPFNPSGAGMYQNPREVIWNSTTPFALPNNINIQFLLPPASIIDCCELTANICVKFTFRDKDCKECEVIVCYKVTIKPGGGHNDDKACNCDFKPVLKYEANGGQTGSKNLNCGETMDLFAGNIFASVLPSFTCKDQNGKDCPGSSLTVTITKPDNTTQVLTGPNYNYTYTLGMPGIFEYTLSGLCGGKKCECKFKVNIPNK